MKITISNEQTLNKELYYEEDFWTGKRTIKYNGIILLKNNKNLYEYKDGEITEQFEIKGNPLEEQVLETVIPYLKNIGITIKMFGNSIEVARKLTWYEIIMSILVFIPCILFGAIGGAFGGAFGFTNIIIIRNIDKWWLKLIISIQFTIISLLLSYIFAFLVLKTFLIIWYIIDKKSPDYHKVKEDAVQFGSLKNYWVIAADHHSKDNYYDIDFSTINMHK